MVPNRDTFQKGFVRGDVFWYNIHAGRKVLFIVSKDISYTRQAVDFVLVYNLGKNPVPDQMKKEEVRESAKREEIAKYLLGKAGGELIRFDLGKYKKLYFREVHTYSEREFEKYLKEMKGAWNEETGEKCEEGK